MDKWQVFTRRLFNEADADPGYYAVMFSGLPQDQRDRLVVAWCAFYNLGLACKLSELRGQRFYQGMQRMFDTVPPVKRGSERRHFRGRQGQNAITTWADLFPQPEDMVEYILQPAYKKRAYVDIRARTNNVPMMGPYFAWKWCDLREVLFAKPVDFTGAEKFSPPVPQKGAEMLFPEMPIEQAYATIVDYARAKNVRTLTGPKREFGIQEAETVCCVYHQYAAGKYLYGIRTAKAIARLEAEPCDASEALIAALLHTSPYSRRDLRALLDRG